MAELDLPSNLSLPTVESGATENKAKYSVRHRDQSKRILNKILIDIPSSCVSEIILKVAVWWELMLVV